MLLELIRSRIAEIERQDRLTEAARNEPAVTRLTEWKLEHPIGRWGRILVHTADRRLASGRTRPATLRTFSPWSWVLSSGCDAPHSCRWLVSEGV
ncbi:hypothetical protein Slala05_70930 [Streptomyces lavendulae subsp. lavendulae]|nr:hypothetical protein Slala05_70930 [Streptomyces lavendulae subsp. lavendulae]